jgi:hypothetical protein
LVEALSFNEKIFKYPPVQYIPMSIYTLERDPNPVPGAGTNTQVRVWQDKKSMEAELSRQPFPLPTTPIDFKERIVVLVTGGQIDYVKYRSHTVFLVGRQVPGSYHLFYLTRRYFYKQRLHFSFFNNSGDRLAWDNIVLSRKP